MAVLKCKMCGGIIELTDATHGKCDSCDTEITLPGNIDDKQAKMFDRGQHFRAMGEFDRAYSAYENLIGDFPNNAEAHWCLALCRYGIMYEKDVRRGGYKPTVSRMGYESILDDPDYLMAVKKSDEATAEIYKREAQRIAAIQKRYREIATNETPYDVFICFKAEDNQTGQRTQSSVRAQEIYEDLTAAGLRVFFSRITLEDKLSVEYEPYIYAALNSAKLMIVVVQDDVNQLKAPWVKNEWSRFIGMKEKNPRKSILTVFKNASPGAFPPELGGAQGINLANPGARFEITRVAKKIAGLKEEQTIITGPVDNNLANLYKRMEQALLDEQFSEVLEISEDILNVEAQDQYAHLAQLLASYKAKDLEDLKRCKADWKNDKYYKRAYRYGNDDLKAKLDDFLDGNQLELRYIKADELEKQEDFLGASEEFKRLGEYKDSYARHKQNEQWNEKKVLKEEYYEKIKYDSIIRIMQKQHGSEMYQWDKLKQQARKSKPVNTSDVANGVLRMIMTITALVIIGWQLYYFAFIGKEVRWHAFTEVQANAFAVILMVPWAIMGIYNGGSRIFHLAAGFLIGCLMSAGLVEFQDVTWVIIGIFTWFTATRHLPGFFNKLKYRKTPKKLREYEASVIEPLKRKTKEQLRLEYEEKIGSSL